MASLHQPGALDALPRLDARHGTHHAVRFIRPDGLWGRWVQALVPLSDTAKPAGPASSRVGRPRAGQVTR
ncbi:DUF6000 family protein [Streptomyces sp. NPDC032161]|uniref:DUF6000 family protein n=1 Tax=unclassified Streptomyces TaxID=2593676 RepID=UPI0033E383CE